METFRPEPEVTYDKPVELNPIHMQDAYIPQKQAEPTYVHEVYLPQLENTYIHQVFLN